MSLATPSACRAKGDLPPQNRVGGVRRRRPLRARRSGPAALQPRRKNRPAPTATASGVPLWPSRDPIEEAGGVNLYAFVGNDAVSKWDLLGWTPYCTPASYYFPPATEEDDCRKRCKKAVCGPDVTQALDTFIAKVTREFNALGYLEQSKVCLSFLGEWDIDQLHTPLMLPDLCGQQSGGNEKMCMKTVTYKGKCHSAATLNYVLLGKMSSMCKLGQDPMKQLIWTYKLVFGGVEWWLGRGRPHHTWRPATAWAVWAYGGGGSPRPGEPDSDRPYCEPCSTAWPGPFTGHAGRRLDGRLFEIS